MRITFIHKPVSQEKTAHLYRHYMEDHTISKSTMRDIRIEGNKNGARQEG